jgi:outer membrane immunogenic protein
MALALLAPLSASAQSSPPSWTGPYGGLNAGFGWGGDATHTGDGGAGSILIDAAFRQVIGLPASTVFPSREQNGIASGGLTGLQLGFNYRFAERWVGGAEVDFQWSDVDGTESNTGPNTAFASTLQTRMALDRFGTARLRLGFLATDTLLVYGTGGLAFGHSHAHTAVSLPRTLPVGFPPTQANCVGNTPCLAGSTSGSGTGWVAGFGAEWAFARNLSVKFEYLHVDLGEQDARLSLTEPLPGGLALGPASGSTRFSNEFDVVRIGLNYRFRN